MRPAMHLHLTLAGDARRSTKDPGAMFCMAKTVVLLVVALAALGAQGQPFQPGTGFTPLGNLRTSDRDGPYNVSLLDTQANEIKGGIAARANFTDKDIVDFLVNVECLEGLFDTWGTFGHGFIGDLQQGGPTPIGAQKANLSPEAEQYLQEVALNEHGHALFTRQAGGKNPCPLVNFTAFDQFMAAAWGLDPAPGANSIEKTFGAPFDPWLNDETFTTSVLSLEELGATGNKGLAGLTSNPVIANGIAALATSANSQATVQRLLLWERRNNNLPPFNETVQQVFARISALRDSLDGPQFDDQGLVNTDPRFIAVPDGYINLIPTDVRGLTFNRSPQMLINILTLGSPDGKGCFFPDGLHGEITVPTGFNTSVAATDDFPRVAPVAGQASTAQIGIIGPPISASFEPPSVPGMAELTQSLAGPLINSSYLSRGYTTPPTINVFGAASGPPVQTPDVTGPAPPVRLVTPVSPLTSAAAAAGAKAATGG